MTASSLGSPPQVARDFLGIQGSWITGPFSREDWLVTARNLLGKLPLDSSQLASVCQAMENQPSEVIEEFVSRTSQSLASMDSLNGRMALLRRSMEVVGSTNEPADRAVQAVATAREKVIFPAAAIATAAAY